MFKGKPHHNIEGDLHMEHYNGRFKVKIECIKLPLVNVIRLQLEHWGETTMTQL